MAIVVNPQGVVGEVPDDQAQAAVAQGYSPASPTQAQSFLAGRIARAKYGTTGQAAIAGVEGAADALTLGGSSWIEKLLGVDPAGIEARSEINPIPHGIGTGIGFLAPLAASGGATGLLEGGAELGSLGARGALRGAAELSAPSMIAKLGQGVTRAVAPEGAGALRTLVGKGLGGAAEGAAIGAGDLVHDTAVGKDVTPGSALEHVALSAGLGGGAGTLFGAGEHALGKLGDTVEGSKVASKLADWLGEAQGTRGLKASGAIQSDIARAEKQLGREGLNKIGQEFFDLGLVGPLSTPASTLDAAKALQEKAGSAIGALLREADEKTAHEELPQIADVLGRVRTEVLKPMVENPLQQDAASRLAGVLDGYDKKFSGGMTVSDLHGMRRQIDGAIYGLRGNMDPFATPMKDALHEFRAIASAEIDKAIEKAGLASTAWKTAKREYQVASVAEDFADRGLRRQHGNNLVSLTELMSGLSGGVAGGPLTGIATGAATALARRHGSGLLGAGAGALRNALRGGAREAVEGAAPRAAEDVSGVVRGGRPGDARIVTPQRPTGEPARYDVVEADELVPSHKAQSFAPNRDYPAGVQERPYHSSEPEQKKVMKIGDRLDPSLVLADTPTAVDGPPIVTSGDRRFVLGGNGRTMGIQRAFASSAVRENYRKALLERAPAFGITAERVAKMRAPVLVRVAERVPANAPKADLVAAVRRFNEGMTQQLSPRARAVAESKVLRATTVESIGQLFADAGDDSLRDLMRKRPQEFITILQRDGLINDTNRAGMVAGEELTSEAKDRIEGMFLGRVVGTGERLEATAPGILNKLERVTPQILRVEGVNPELSEIPTVQAALDLINRAARNGVTVEQLLGQGALKGMADRATPDAATLAMVELLQKENQAQLAARFTKWARAAAIDPRQGLMFEKPPTPLAARKVLFAGSGVSDAALGARIAPPAEPVAPPAPPPLPAETAAAVKALSPPPPVERMANAGYARNALVQIAAHDAPESTSYGIHAADPEMGLERSPRDVAEGIAPLAAASLLSGDPSSGKGLMHDVGTSVSPRLVEALAEIQAKAFAQATGASDDGETKRLLKAAAQLGYGGPFTSAENLLARAQRGLLHATDPKERTDIAAIVEMARAAVGANVDARLAPLSAEVTAAAWSHGHLAAMGASALKEIRARYGADLAGAIAPALRKASKGPVPGIVPPGPFHEEQAATRTDMNAAIAQLGGRPHVAPSPETSATIAVLARHAEEFAKGLDHAATAVVSGKVPENLRGKPMSKADTLKMMDSVRRLASNPQRLVNELERHTASLADHAPQTGQAAATTLSAGVQYLATQLPHVRPPTLQDPESGLPSGAAITAWSRKADAVLHPLEVLAAGPSPDAVAALQAVYPGVWTRWRAGAVNALATAAADGRPPSYQTLSRVSSMIGQALVPAQQQPMLALVPVPSTPAPQPDLPENKAVPVRGGGKSNFASSLRTGTQRVEAGQS